MDTTYTVAHELAEAMDAATQAMRAAMAHMVTLGADSTHLVTMAKALALVEQARVLVEARVQAVLAAPVALVP